jgi:hypothetical protein
MPRFSRNVLAAVDGSLIGGGKGDGVNNGNGIAWPMHQA